MVSRAWQVREDFKDLFNQEKEYDSASTLFLNWISEASRKKIKEVTKVVDMFKNHFKGIVNALIFSFSNAMAERLNGKIQEVKLTA